MRANIEIDDELMAQAMRTTGLQAKAAVVDMALQRLLTANLGESSAPDIGWSAGLERHSAVDGGSLLGRQAELELFAAHMGLGAVE